MARKQPSEFIINGRVVHRASGTGLVGLRVEAWDRALIFDDLVGSSVADAQGAFRLTFDESYFSEIFLDRRPDLYFRVFRDDVLIGDTKDRLWWNVSTGTSTVTIEVDLPRPEPPPQENTTYRVFGVVRDSGGVPLSGFVSVPDPRQILPPSDALAVVLTQ